VCVSLFYVIRVIDTGSIRPRARIKVTELGVTYLPLTLSVCFFVLCNRHWFNKTPGPDPRGTELEVGWKFLSSSRTIQGNLNVKM
jgi:hypothetical protein